MSSKKNWNTSVHNPGAGAKLRAPGTRKANSNGLLRAEENLNE
jgi:hypothetical protein